MDVHPPDHPILTWRQFLVHIGTITVGLLIAIGLEQTVELLHRKHQLHVAEHNLQVELESNRKRLAQDEASLEANRQYLLRSLRAIELIREGHPPKELSGNWAWSDLQAAAWDTARNNGITALMPYSEAQQLDDRYVQQALVNRQALVFVRDIYQIMTPFSAGKQIDQLTPGDLDHIQNAIETTLADLAQLKSLCAGLDDEYK